MFVGRVTLAVVLLTVSVAFVSWFVYKPLPDDLQEPWKARTLLAIVKFIGHSSLIGDRLGLGNGHDISRSMVNFFSRLPIKDYAGLEVSDTVFDGVPVRTYVPKMRGRLSAGMVFFHGGGWILGSTESHDHITAALARRLNIVVVSVDYRLCPEHPYPIPLEDSLTATLHFYKHAADYGVDPTRIAITGDSAGGNLAAAVCLKLKVSGHKPMPKHQVLIYPTLQAFDFNLPSHRQNDDVVLGSNLEVAGAVLFYMGADLYLVFDVATNNHTTSEMKRDYTKFVDTNLIPQDLQKDYKRSCVENGDLRVANQIRDKMMDPFCMPLMASNLKGLPEAYIITAEYDPLRDDGILYAKRLERSGVKATWVNYKDGYHGVMACIIFPVKTKVGLQMMNDLVNFLRENL